MKHVIKIQFEASSGTITLPQKYTDITAIKVMKCVYKVVTAGQRELLLSIDGFNTRDQIKNNVPYFFEMDLFEFVSTFASYADLDHSHMDWETSECYYPKDLNQLRFKWFIDGQLLPDISAANPIYMTLAIWSRD